MQEGAGGEEERLAWAGVLTGSTEPLPDRILDLQHAAVLRHLFDCSPLLDSSYQGYFTKIKHKLCIEAAHVNVVRVTDILSSLLALLCVEDEAISVVDHAVACVRARRVVPRCRIFLLGLARGEEQQLLWPHAQTQTPTYVRIQTRVSSEDANEYTDTYTAPALFHDA